MDNQELALHFFSQLVIILLSCRFVGLIAARYGQPQVVAEMLTGILLGPSFFGFFAPKLHELIFPWDVTQKLRDTQSYLYPISQLGLVLYMFMVGLEFNIDTMKQRFKSSIAVSIAGIITPFVLGTILGWIFYFYTDFFSEKTTLLVAMLFLGASMCITAFPVLARIVDFKKLSGTVIGTVALGGASIDDVSAWCLLAIVLASFSGDFTQALVAITSSIGYVALALLVIKPLLYQIKNWLQSDGELNEIGMILCLALMALGAWFTDIINLHAVFGAFIMGIAMPREIIVRDLIKRIQPLTLTLLLPLFFTYSGLNTKIGLLNSAYLWTMCGLVLILAIFGKVFACWLAAIWTGISNREAIGIGILMNARGLMELIIINIGLQRGIISESLFAILVIMAFVTTLMASPIFESVVGSSIYQKKSDLDDIANIS